MPPVAVCDDALRLTMSIDKESTGLPEIDVHRRTTKVNLATMVAVLVFLAIAAAAIIWFASRHG
jgi:hypothetical protein